MLQAQFLRLVCEINLSCTGQSVFSYRAQAFSVHYHFCFCIAVLQVYKQWMWDVTCSGSLTLNDVTINRVYAWEAKREIPCFWLLVSLFTSCRKNITFHSWCSHGLKSLVYQVFQQEEVELSSWAIGILLARWALALLWLYWILSAIYLKLSLNPYSFHIRNAF